MGASKITKAFCRRFLRGVGVAALTGGMLNAGAESIKEPRTEFEGVDCDKLMSVYKQAYIEAGFHLAKETTRKNSDLVFTELEFRLSFPASPGKKPPLASFSFYSFLKKAQDRVSCFAARGGFGGGDLSYTDEEWSSLHAKLVSADKQAAAQVARKVGKSLP